MTAGSYPIQTQLDNTMFPASTGAWVRLELLLQSCQCRGCGGDSWLILLPQGPERVSAVLLCQRIWAHGPTSRIGVYLQSASHRSSGGDLGILPLLRTCCGKKASPETPAALVGSSCVKIVPCGDHQT